MDDNHIEVSAFGLVEGRAGPRLFDDEVGAGLRLVCLGKKRDDTRVDGADCARQLYRAGEGGRTDEKSGECDGKFFHDFSYTVHIQYFLFVWY